MVEGISGAADVWPPVDMQAVSIIAANTVLVAASSFFNEVESI